VTKFVSIVIPCRNEEKYISKCLDSIISQDYPKHRLEILIVDGMSEDRTRAIVEEYAKRHPTVRIVNNPKRIIPSAMNIGIQEAQGEVIMKVDAHSTYPKDYISKCVRYLTTYGADNVGGMWRICPGKETTMAKAIALTLGHPFASGNAYIKVKAKGPRWADTAAFGCYRREVFDKIGLFNESLAGSSDLDFNKRLKAAGGKILLVPEIVINYYADSDLKSFWRHNFADGVWATYVLKFKSRAFSWRHWIPLAFVSSLIGSAALSVILPWTLWLLVGIVGLYTLVNLGVSTALAVKERKVQYLWALPIVFATRHFAHGLGALLGLVLAIVPGVHWQGRRGKFA
jgi:glycosyltransferase involved in cell wall biosynthesis